MISGVLIVPPCRMTVWAHTILANVGAPRQPPTHISGRMPVAYSPRHRAAAELGGARIGARLAEDKGKQGTCLISHSIIVLVL